MLTSLEGAAAILRGVCFTVVFAGALFASPSKSGASTALPHKLEFLPQEECGDRGYRVSAEQLGSFSHLIVVELCEVKLRRTYIAGQEWIVPVVKDAGHQAVPGTPDVPAIRLFFAAPAGTEVFISQLSMESGYLDGLSVAPAKADYSEKVGPVKESVVNLDAYSQAAYPSQPVLVATSFAHRRALSINVLEVAPVQYSPNSVGITVHSRLEFIVEASSPIVSQAAWANVSGDWAAFYRSVVVNPDDVDTTPLFATNEAIGGAEPLGPSEPPNAPDGEPYHYCGKYLVLCADNLHDRFLTSLTYERLKQRYEPDTDVVVVRMSDIVGENPDLHYLEIRGWIMYCDPLPDYFLIVGDTHAPPGGTDYDRVPAYWSVGIPEKPYTDNYYCSDLDHPGTPSMYDSSLPEIWCARIPARVAGPPESPSYEEFDAMDTKITTLDSSLGGCAGSRRICSASGLGDFGANARQVNLQKASNQFGLHVREMKRLTADASEELRDCFDSTPTVVTYRGHGTPSMLSAMSFDSEDVAMLQEQAFWPLMYSVACRTGHFAQINKRCIGEELVLNPTKGVAQFLGASSDTGHYRNNTMLGALILQSFLKLTNYPDYRFTLGQIVEFSKWRVPWTTARATSTTIAPAAGAAQGPRTHMSQYPVLTSRNSTRNSPSRSGFRLTRVHKAISWVRTAGSGCRSRTTPSPP